MVTRPSACQESSSARDTGPYSSPSSVFRNQFSGAGFVDFAAGVVAAALLAAVGFGCDEAEVGVDGAAGAVGDADASPPAAGTSITSLHFGQRIFFPATLSGTRNLPAQEVQAT